MKRNTFKLATLSVATAFGILTLNSCEKEHDHDHDHNESEVITTVNVTLIPTSGGDTVLLSWKDVDGDGGNAPVIVGGTFENNKTYAGSVKFLNEQKNPVEDITAEISGEAAEHQLFYTSSVPGVSFAYGDTDSNGKPLGLVFSITTTQAGTGNLNITLKHEPDKNASGVAQGNIANAGGETDVAVDFPITIQ